MCAALGKLKDQNSRNIQFAWPPSVLSMSSSAGVFGECSGWTDKPCHMPWVGFANNDVYYLEVCLFSQVCQNREELFALTDSKTPFICQIDTMAFAQLRNWLIEGEGNG